jgi:hypothetical protein
MLQPRRATFGAGGAQYCPADLLDPGRLGGRVRTARSLPILRRKNRLATRLGSSNADAGSRLGAAAR